MNYYEILEISKKASNETIKAAFKVQAKIYHPDVFQGDRDFAEQKMKELNTIRDVLLDPFQRALYDASLVEPNSNTILFDHESTKNDEKSSDIETENKDSNTVESNSHSENIGPIRFEREKANNKTPKFGFVFYTLICLFLVSGFVSYVNNNDNLQSKSNHLESNVTTNSLISTSELVEHFDAPPVGSNGICNSGFIYHENWLYYINKSSLFRTNKLGNSIETLYIASEGEMNSFIIAKNKIFIGADHTIYSMNLDGTNREFIATEYSGSPLLLKDNWLIYDGLDGAYRVDVENITQNIRISGYGTALGFFASDKGIIYTNRFNSIDRLVYFTLDNYFVANHESILISEQPGCEKSINVVEYNGWIYFISDEGICRIDFGGLKKQVLVNNISGSGWLNIQDNYLFGSCNDGTFRINLEDLTYEKICDYQIMKMNIVGDWIYFAFEGYGGQYSFFNTNWNKMKTDGSQFQLVNKLGY